MTRRQFRRWGETQGNIVTVNRSIKHALCILITLGAIFAAELAVAPFLLLLTYGTTSVAEVGEVAGGMMIPAIMLCVFALFRDTKLFAVLALLCCPGLAYLVYLGAGGDHASDGAATFYAIQILAGSAIAIPIVALRMRGRWKSWGRW